LNLLAIVAKGSMADQLKATSCQRLRLEVGPRAGI
jgi:hypothetical protein